MCQIYYDETAEFVLKDLFFVLIVFTTAENMSFIHIKQ